jgi:hypothetical protein
MTKWLLLLLVFLATPAFAEVKTFTWVGPTQREDGTPFDAATEQAQSNIYCIRDGVISSTVYVAPGAVVTFDIDFTPGSYVCDSTVVDMNGLESIRSNSSSFVIGPVIQADPKTNTGFTVS